MCDVAYHIAHGSKFALLDEELFLFGSLSDFLLDTKFKIILNNQVERTLAVCAAVVLDSLPTPDQLKQLLVSQSILEQVKTSTDSRICHEALGTDEESHVRPMRSVRGT